MNKLLVVFMGLFLLVSVSWADVLVLDTPQQVASPMAYKVEVDIQGFDAKENLIQVRHRWLDENGVWIPVTGSDSRGWVTFNCKNVPVPGENAACLDVGDPWECCDGLGTGSCDELLDTCFSDVFRFKVRQQDVGTSIGAGLRTLMMNKWKSKYLPDNSGEFEDE
jgi:hypothetical protein